MSTPDTTTCTSEMATGRGKQMQSLLNHSPPKTQSTWSHSSGVTLTVQNVTITVNLQTKLDLKKIVLSARNAEYNPKRFAACIMRMREPKCTSLVFASGKMIVTGSKSPEDARQGARKFLRIIQKVGFTGAKLKELTVQNMVATCDLSFPIRLEGLHFSHSQFSSYEPELFPGLIYRHLQPKVVLLVFVSGKVVLTGGKSLQDLQHTFDLMYPVFCEFRKQVQSPILIVHLSTPNGNNIGSPINDVSRQHKKRGGSGGAA